MLRTLGTLLFAGGTASAHAKTGVDESYRVSQGGQSVAVEPLSGDETVEAFYGFHLPEGYTGTGVDEVGGSGAYYESTGTRSLQRESTTITFLYDGPKGLSLVVVHDESTPDGDGGSATWDVLVRPADVEWLVQDDSYWEAETGERATSNYDNWHTDGARHRIDWTWAAGATDGAALGYLKAQTALLIRPAYNERAALAGEYYSGTVTDWQFLSGDIADPDRVSLALDEPVVVTGPKRADPPNVAGEWGPGTDGPAEHDGGVDEERNDDRRSSKERLGEGDEDGEASDDDGEDEGYDDDDGRGERVDDESDERVDDENDENEEGGEDDETESDRGKGRGRGRGNGA